MKRSMTFLLIATAYCVVGCATTSSPKQQMSDGWITSKIKSKLTADPEVNPFEVDVDTQDGVVRLSGMVEEEGDRAQAEEIARNTDGVREVVNNIEIGDVSLGEHVSDAGITSKVKSKLAADPEVTAMNVDVDTMDGVVTLSGLVRTERQRDEAEHLARNTNGVREVRNLLEVVQSE